MTEVESGKYKKKASLSVRAPDRLRTIRFVALTRAGMRIGYAWPPKVLHLWLDLEGSLSSFWLLLSRHGSTRWSCRGI